VAGNFRGPGHTADDVRGNVSGSYKVIGVGAGLSGINDAVDGNQIGTAASPVDPMLGPLADNGGPTLTHALVPGSPAINAGNNALIPAGVSTDQRGIGFPRISGSRVDIGAVESAPPDNTPPTVLEAWFDFDAAPLAVRIRLSEPIDAASILAGRLVVVDLPTTSAVPVQTPAYDPVTATVSFPLGALADGNYRATLKAGSVRDAAGNPLAADFALDFFVLAGDANRDRKVDFADLVVLAQNYGQSGKRFSEGDFGLDRNVGFADLVILAQRYNTTLPPPPDASDTAVAAPALGSVILGLSGHGVTVKHSQPVPIPKPTVALKRPIITRRAALRSKRSPGRSSEASLPFSTVPIRPSGPPTEAKRAREQLLA
jgi:hypothetical protein